MSIMKPPDRAGSQLAASAPDGSVSCNGIPRVRTRLSGILVLVVAALCVAHVFSSVHTAFAFTEGQPLDTGFPRLAAYLPETATAPDKANTARFDWVCLTEFQESAIAGLKDINPDLIALRRTDACEECVARDSELSRLPASWILTQLGTTLAGNVDAVTQSIPVTALTNGNLQLFAIGEYVLIGGEVCTITQILTAPDRLIVTRGTAYPAAPHSAGERVAAAVTAFPGTVTMNLTDRCPSVDLGDGNGPQTWRTWRVRDSLAAVSDPVWDGIYMDVSEGHKSHLVGPSSPPYSIDYQRTNVPATDGYAAFDSAWDAGIQALDAGIVAGLRGRIYFTNGPFPDYGLRNGTTFEDFPSNSWDWRTTIFGPRDPGGGDLQGSVMEWMNAAEPNLTTLLVYPTPHSNTILDYRLIRFGLCSALLAGTHYSYEIGGTPKVLPWFDEYDGGGLGRGYLGQPLGAARDAIPPLTTADLFDGDGAFDSAVQLGAWSLWADPGYSATKSHDTVQKAVGTSSAKVSITQSAGTTWKVQMRHSVALESGKPYTLTFKARADRPLTVGAHVDRVGGATYARYLDFGIVALDGQWRTFEIPATSSGSDAAAGLRLNVGEKVGTVWLDDVKLQQGTRRDVLRRDFEGGVALVNATDQTVSVDLGGTFRKIKGTQAPSVNDGSLVTAVTLPPKDGIVLLRDGSAPVPDTTAPQTTPDAVVTPASTPKPTYRFYNRRTGSHFYTASAAERDSVIARYPDVFTFEGVAYWLDTSSPDMDTPLYRFYNRRTGSHFYTASAAERDSVIARYPDVFTFEGVAYNVATEAAGNTPVYRFYNVRNGTHFYTASAAEKSYVIATYSSTYRYEGVAYYLAP